MPKKRTPEQDPDEIAPVFYATAKYKLWVRRRLAEKGKEEAGDSAAPAKPWSLGRLAKEIKRRFPAQKGANSGNLSQFLGLEDAVPKPSNTTLMPAINKVLGAAPPPICDPDDELAQLRDALAARWPKMNDLSRKRFLAAWLDDEE